MLFTTLPFTIIPLGMTLEIVYSQLFWLNLFILTDYISNTSGPGSIISGCTYDYNLLYGRGSQFGEYVQTHKVTDSTM